MTNKRADVGSCNVLIGIEKDGKERNAATEMQISHATSNQTNVNMNGAGDVAYSSNAVDQRTHLQVNRLIRCVKIKLLTVCDRTSILQSSLGVVGGG